MDEITAIEIILGSYEEFLLGYKFFPKSQEIKQTFATHSHSSSIRSICVSGNYVASGGADDRIFVYDLKNRKEHCALTHHNATVNCIAFTPEHTHVLTGSADGVLAIVRVGNWQLEKIWENTHKGSPILDIAVHSSGKLALTLGTDHTLCTWNLVKGRQAYIINLNSKSKDPKSLERVVWAPCGIRFALCGGKYTEIWSIEKGGMLNAVEHPTKVTCCSWKSDNTLLIGYENGKLATVDTENGKIKSYEGHKSRVKGVAIFRDIIVSGASGGDVKVWDEKLNLLAECSTGCRITCLQLSPYIPRDVKENIIKTETDEESEEESETEIGDEAQETIKVESESEEEIVIVPKSKNKKQRVQKEEVENILMKKTKKQKVQEEVVSVGGKKIKTQKVPEDVMNQPIKTEKKQKVQEEVRNVAAKKIKTQKVPEDVMNLSVKKEKKQKVQEVSSVTAKKTKKQKLPEDDMNLPVKKEKKQKVQEEVRNVATKKMKKQQVLEDDMNLPIKKAKKQKAQKEEVICIPRKKTKRDR